MQILFKFIDDMLVREFLTAGERRGTQGTGLGINQLSMIFGERISPDVIDGT